MSKVEFAISVLVAVAVNLLSQILVELSPSLARRLVRRAARLRHPIATEAAWQLQRWEAEIERRKGNLLKLGTALRVAGSVAAFATGQMAARVTVAYRRQVAVTAAIVLLAGIGTAAADLRALQSPDMASHRRAAPTPDHTDGCRMLCLYDRISFGHPRGSVSTCGRTDLHAYGWHNRLESAEFRASSGRAVFYSVGATAAAHDDYPLFFLSPSHRRMADVNPFRNQADYVLVECA